MEHLDSIKMKEELWAELKFRMTKAAFMRDCDPDVDEDGSAEWFVAYQMAVQLMEMNTTKDWARQLIDGFKPLDRAAAQQFVWDEFMFQYKEDDEPFWLWAAIEVWY